jgi:hypothetical protein
MAGPKYLTRDKAGIKEFLDKFDVGRAQYQFALLLTTESRHSSSTAMVRIHCSFRLPAAIRLIPD